MPRYFFNVRDGRSEIDEEGTVLTNLEEARRDAIRLAGHIFRDDADSLALGGATWLMEVTDEDSRVLFRLDFQVTG